MQTTPPLNQRVVQITAIPEGEHQSFIVFALTADGSILSNTFDQTFDPPDWGEWVPLPPISAGGQR